MPITPDQARWLQWFVYAAHSVRQVAGCTAPLIFEGDNCRLANTHFEPPAPANRY